MRSRQDHDNRALRAALVAVIRPDADRPRVLVADDNADMRRYVGRLLAGRYTVEAVPDGAAALASVRRQPPDLILSDVMMPRLDGFGLLRELRADPRTASVPVILLSARAGEESRVEGVQAAGFAEGDFRKELESKTPLGRIGQPVDIAPAAVFLASNDSAWITGQTLHISGGLV